MNNLSKDEIINPYRTIKPVVSINGIHYTIRDICPFSESYIWQPSIKEKIDELRVLRRMTTIHKYKYPNWFQPKICETLSQIPKDIISDVKFFETKVRFNDLKT